MRDTWRTWRQMYRMDELLGGDIPEAVDDKVLRRVQELMHGTVEEQVRLANLEAWIERAREHGPRRWFRQSFDPQVAGIALYEIKTRELYRVAGFSSFEQYLSDRYPEWKLSLRRARRLIERAPVKASGTPKLRLLNGASDSYIVLGEL